MSFPPLPRAHGMDTLGVTERRPRLRGTGQPVQLLRKMAVGQSNCVFSSPVLVETAMVHGSGKKVSCQRDIGRTPNLHPGGLSISV